MSYVTWFIEYTPFIDNDWNSSDTINFTTFRNPIMSAKLGDSRDSFSMQVPNVRNMYDNYFNPNDKVAVFRAVNSSTKPDVPIMIITLKDTPEDYSYNKKEIKIEGYNFSESVLSAVTYVDVTNRQIPYAFKDALDDISQDNTNFSVTWNDDNPLVNTNGDAFPTVNKKFFYAPLRKLIEEFSQNEQTLDGNYYWYVDNNNTLVWDSAYAFSEDSFNSSTDPYTTMKIGKDTSGIKNYFILKGGMDPVGHQITQPHINQTSVAKHGRKFMLVVDATTQNTAKELLNQDLVDSYDLEDVQALAETFPKEIEDGTSFTTSWVSNVGTTTTTKKYGIVMTNGVNVTINEGSAASNKGAYVEVIRAEVKARLINRGEEIAYNLQYGKLQVDLSFKPGSKSWGLGDIITCTIGTIKDNEPTPMRVREIQYTSNGDTYSLEEDVGSL